MKCLAVFERLNLDLPAGDSLMVKALLEGLALGGFEVSAVCHGSSKGIKIYPPGSFEDFSRIKTARRTEQETLSAVQRLLSETEVESAILNLWVLAGNSLWERTPFFSRNDSQYFRRLRRLLNERKIPFHLFTCGITEKNSFASFFAGQTREVHLKQMNSSNGVITISALQSGLLRQMGVRVPLMDFPASCDLEEFRPFKPRKSFLDESSSVKLLLLDSRPRGKDLKPFLEKLQRIPGAELVISADATPQLITLLNSMKLNERVRFVGEVRHDDAPELINSCDVGVYLKRFGTAVGDASTFMKLSEYLACGKPVLVPSIAGAVEQAGGSGIQFEAMSAAGLGSLLSDSARLEGMALKARVRAERFFDVRKNTARVASFIEKTAGVVK